MRETNNPDVALAWEWIEELEEWVRDNGLLGYDRFDIKDNVLFKRFQSNRYLRKISSGIAELFPKLTRVLLRVKHTENPKAHALMALGYLRLYQIEKQSAHLEKVDHHLSWLRAKRVTQTEGWSWGYPFAYSGKGVNVPANTPVSVVTAIVGNAYILAYEVTRDERYLPPIFEIAKFFTEVLPVFTIKSGGKCFAYALQGDPRKVHNANLLVAEFLYNVSRLAGEDKYREFALPALEFSLKHQNEDGSWFYGYWEEEENVEIPLLQIIDNHHTGFVLRSLYGIYCITPVDEIKSALLKGFQFYVKNLFNDIGQPYFAVGKRYPVDIHACAEGILCPSLLYEVIPSAHVLAVFVLRWSWFYMRNRKTGDLYYRKYRFFTSKITFPRWGVAWMFRALAEYLYHFHEVKERVERLKLQAIRWLPDPNFLSSTRL